MIEITMIEGLTCPLVYCDTCGHVIRKAAEAGVVLDNGMDEGQRFEPIYVHKDFVNGGCMTFQEKLLTSQGKEHGWVELQTYFKHLLDNTKMTLADMKRQFDWDI